MFLQITKYQKYIDDSTNPKSDLWDNLIKAHNTLLEYQKKKLKKL